VGVEAFRWAKREGAKTLAITDSANSPIVGHADVTLICDTSRSISFTESLTSALAVIHALIVGVSLQSKDIAAKSLQKLESLYKLFGSFALRE
jgi:DNA-binding MurR/RpiR family transcriptional regulator